MILRLAYKNILGYGWRSLIIVFMLAMIITLTLWMEAMYHSWVGLAKTQQEEWEYGSNMLRSVHYDPLDAFTWDKSYGPIPEALKGDIKTDKAVPVLFSPAVIYPQGRSITAMVKGIPARQKMLKFPTAKLAGGSSLSAPVIIGTQMAKMTKLAEGDMVTMRVKDAYGAFNTLDLEVAAVIRVPVPSMDAGVLWVDLGVLQELKQLPDMATTIASVEIDMTANADQAFTHLDRKALFKDLDEMMQTETVQKFIMYILLMFLAMIAIFDTQALAVFKRRKEIGTLNALGMTSRQIVALFTVEGIMYYLLAVVMTAIIGTPVLWYFAKWGYALPDGYDDFGLAGFSEPLLFKYPIGIVANVLIWIFVITAVVSWIPARRIAAMKPTDALKGKVA